MRIGILLLVFILLIPLVSCHAIGSPAESFDPAKLAFIRTNELGDDVFFIPDSMQVNKDRLTVTFIGRKKNKSAGVQSYKWLAELKPGANMYKTLSVTNFDAAGRSLSTPPSTTEWRYAVPGDPYDALIQTVASYCREKKLPLDTTAPVYASLGFRYVVSTKKAFCFVGPATIKVENQYIQFQMLEVLSEPLSNLQYTLSWLTIDRLQNKVQITDIGGYDAAGRQTLTRPDIPWTDLGPPSAIGNALHYALGHARHLKAGLLKIDPAAAQDKQYYWYDPYSIRVFTDYISVVILTEDPSVVPGDAGYVLYTIYFQPEQNRAKLAVGAVYDKNGTLLSYSGASFWRTLKPDTPGAKLLPRVLDHIRDNRLSATPTPPFATPDLQFAADASPRNAIFFNPASIQAGEGTVAVETVFDLITPKEDGAKYSVMTVTFRIADKQYKTSEAIRYSDSGEQVGTTPGQNWTPLLPGASYEKFLEHLLDYCRKNNIPI